MDEFEVKTRNKRSFNMVVAVAYRFTLLFLFNMTVLNNQKLVNAYQINKSVKSDASWVYVDRFVFNPSDYEAPGRLDYTIEFNTNDKLFLLVYDDKNGAFDGALSSSAFCSEKHNNAVGKFSIEKLDYELVPNSDGMRAIVSWWIQFIFVRPRWVFLALSNCDPDCGLKDGEFCQSPIDVVLNLTFTNGDSQTASREFSADEIGIMEVSMIATLIHVFIACYAAYVCVKLQSIGKLHHTVKILFASTIFAAFSRFFTTTHYIRFSDDGQGSLVLYEYAHLLFMVADILLVLLSILLAKGWTIVRRKISAQGRMKIASYITLYFSVSTFAMVWNVMFPRPPEVTTKYDSFAGYILVALRVVAFLWFTYATYTTLKNFKSKRRFYIKFYLIISCYILSTPAVFVASFYIPLIYRSKIIVFIEYSIFAFTQLVLVMMYTPNMKCNSSFPFHKRTKDMNSSNYASNSSDKKSKNTSKNGEVHTRESSGRRKSQVLPDFGEHVSTPDNPQSQELLVIDDSGFDVQHVKQLLRLMNTSDTNEALKEIETAFSDFVEMKEDKDEDFEVGNSPTSTSFGSKDVSNIKRNFSSIAEEGNGRGMEGGMSALKRPARTLSSDSDEFTSKGRFEIKNNSNNNNDDDDDATKIMQRIYNDGGVFEDKGTFEVPEAVSTVRSNRRYPPPRSRTHNSGATTTTTSNSNYDSSNSRRYSSKSPSRSNNNTKKKAPALHEGDILASDDL